MDQLADALLEYETLDAEEVEAIFKGNPGFVKAKKAAEALSRDSSNSSAAGMKMLPPNLDGADRKKEPGVILGAT